MAKAGNSNLLEQHVEKAVLGLSVLFLLYAVFHWLLGTPEKWEANPQPPESIAQWDGWLLGQATREENRVTSYVPKTSPTPAYADALNQLINNPMPAYFVESGIELTRPRVPVTSGVSIQQSERIALADLVKLIPAPDTPKLNAKRVLVRDKMPDLNASAGVSVYPWAELGNRWNDKLKSTTVIPSIVVQEFRVERQELKPDGTWSDPVRVILEPIALVDAGADHKELAVPVVPPLDAQNADAVHAAIENLRRIEWQQQVVQPAYPDIFWPATHQWVDWRILLPTNELSNVEGEPLSAERSGAQTPAAAPTLGVTTRPVGPAPFIPARPTGNMPPAAPGPMGPGPMGPGPMGPGLRPPMMPSATPTPARPSPSPTPSPTPSSTPHPTATPAGTPVQPKMQFIPILTRQMQLGKLLCWFFDPTMESGKVYRYRVSMKFINPLLGCTRDVKAPEDALVATVDSPWSSWSEPASVRGAAEFFLTGSFENTQEATVTLFSTSMGQIVRQSVQVKAGQAIGSKIKLKVNNPVNPQQKIDAEVDFSTGATAVGLNFNKIIWKGNTSKKTTELLYLDSDGELKTRLLDIDLSSKAYKDLDQSK
jgi:hypothetical protein